MKNLCCGCSRDFTSVAAFDRHRTGRYMPDTRRCLTEQEMSERGLERKPSGQWGNVKTDRDRARLAWLTERERQKALALV